MMAFRPGRDFEEGQPWPDARTRSWVAFCTCFLVSCFSGLFWLTPRQDRILQAEEVNAAGISLQINPMMTNELVDQTALALARVARQFAA